MRVEEEPVAPVTPVQPSPQPIEPPAELSDVYFDFDQYAIRADARSTLEHIAGLLKSELNEGLVIEGHCDERGTSAYNFVLGERRAQAAKQFLQELGLALSQIEITSYGKERPFCTEHSEACWQSNRRVHFRKP
jgi:peptidoglycan-associated lipoprotein